MADKSRQSADPVCMKIKGTGTACRNDILQKFEDCPYQQSDSNRRVTGVPMRQVVTKHPIQRQREQAKKNGVSYSIGSVCPSKKRRYPIHQDRIAGQQNEQAN
jgi:hypothetical protein